MQSVSTDITDPSGKNSLVSTLASSTTTLSTTTPSTATSSTTTPNSNKSYVPFTTATSYSSTTSTPSTTATPSTTTTDVIEKMKTGFISFMSNKIFFYCLIIFLIISFGFFVFFKGYSAEGVIISVIIDLFILFLAITGITYLYVSTTLQKEDLFLKCMNIIEKLFASTNSSFIIIIIMIIYYLFLFIIGINELKPITIRIIETIVWIFLILCIINDGMKYLFDIKIADICIKQIYLLWNQTHGNKVNTETETKTKAIPIIDNNEEVFNIANNSYTYQDAQAICKSYDARLATYDDIEKSYKNGGEWCNYGWSDSQMILFPTQKSTWNELQKSSTNKNNCGRPGINGGYLNDSSKKYGVNCYGKKPKAKNIDETTNIPKIIKSKEDIILDAKIKYWRENADNMLTVNSFNSNQWNEV